MEENNNIQYSEEILEMASVFSANSDPYYNRLLAVNPDIRRDGNPYFKYYKLDTYGNKSGNQVARISFKTASYILHNSERTGIPTWKDPYPNTEDKKRLVDILNSPSEEYPNYTVWTVLKFHWNYEKGFRGNIDDFISGKIDQKYLNQDIKGNYVSYSLQMPNYLNL